MNAIITTYHLGCSLETIKEAVSKGAIPSRSLMSVYLDEVNENGVTTRQEWIYNTENIMNKHSCIVFLKGRLSIEEKNSLTDEP
jgi:hypothetical protein